MNDRSLLLALADALTSAATTLRHHAAAGVHFAADRETQPADVVERARVMHPLLGPRQAQVLALLAKAHPDGTDTGHLSREMGYDQPNVYLTLQGLAQLGMVARDSTVRPHRYRLAGPLAHEEAGG